MKRLPVVLLCTLLSTALGCGGDDDSGGANANAEGGYTSDSDQITFDQLFPADDEVAGWAEDPSQGSAGVELANSDQEAIDMINGAADPFVEHGFIRLGIEHYASGDATLELRIWKMNNASVARQLYSYLASDDAVYAVVAWEDLDGMGQEARIADTGAAIWVNARSGAHLVESKINQVDDQARTDVQAFAIAVLSKL